MASSRPLLLQSRVSTRSVSSLLNHPKKPTVSPFPQASSPKTRISRLPVESRCLVSMMPLHSAIASARLISVLSPESQSWGRVPLGLSMPL